MTRLVPALALALVTTLVPLGAFAAHEARATRDAAAQELVAPTPPNATPAVPARPTTVAAQNTAAFYGARVQIGRDERRVGQDDRDIRRDERELARDRARGDVRDATRAWIDLRRDEGEMHHDVRDVFHDLWR